MVFTIKDTVKGLHWKTKVDQMMSSFLFTSEILWNLLTVFMHSYLFQKLVGWTHVLFVNIGIWIRWSIWGHSIGISSLSLLLLVSLISKSAQKQVVQEMFSGGISLFLAFILPDTVEGHFWLAGHSVYSRFQWYL